MAEILKLGRRATVLFFFCSWSIWSSAAAVSSAENSTVLTAADARARSTRVSEVRYELEFRFDAASTQFEGKATIFFSLADTRDDLRIDFTEGEVLAVIVNASPVEAKALTREAGIFIPQDRLRVGKNQIRIEYTHPFSRTGNGLYRFVDPVDQAVYLYSNFEPYYAHLMFPCFDQPDLKAEFATKVRAPSDWTVISNGLESRIETTTHAQGPTMKVWEFPAGKPMSTYLYALHAGPYKIWSDKAGKIPLRLLARQSLAAHVDSSFWFRITRQGFAFFQPYFAYAYPFEKYDQIFVPDFLWGGMENIGAVTFNENFIKRSETTYFERTRAADVILHEMAHMWFGDLVTMKWWGDLWLNESFASYMAVVARVEATEFKDAWRDFFGGMRQWAFYEDSFSTRHPIAHDVSDTEMALSSLDGITYGKGAASLKQLSVRIGSQAFRDGMRGYFQKHAFKNAELKDFLDALAVASKTPKLSEEFGTEWLRTLGTNSLQVDYECSDGKLQKFDLVQGAPEDAPTLRTHKTVVALYDDKGNARVRERSAEAFFYQGTRTSLTKYIGKACPALVNGNKGDHDHVELKVEPKSLVSISTLIPKLKDPLDRMMMLRSVWAGVADGRFDPAAFSSLALGILQDEKTQSLIRLVLQWVGLGRDTAFTLYDLLSSDAWDAKSRQQIMSQWESLAWKKWKTTKMPRDERLLWLGALVSFARTEQAREWLAQTYKGAQGTHSKSSILDQDRRWAILVKLCELDHPEVGSWIEAETKMDPSHKGKQSVLACQAARSDYDDKKKLFLDVISPQKSARSLSDKLTIMAHLFPANQAAIHRKFTDDFFNVLTAPPQGDDQSAFLSKFVSNLVPRFCSEASAQRLRKFVDLNPNLPVNIVRPLRIETEGDERCARVVAKVGR